MGGCGREAYPMGFGYKYCRRFQESKEMFDQEVREKRLCAADPIKGVVWMAMNLHFPQPHPLFASCRRYSMEPPNSRL